MRSSPMSTAARFGAPYELAIVSKRNRICPGLRTTASALVADSDSITQVDSEISEIWRKDWTT